MVAAVSVLGGVTNANALDELRLMARHLHAWTITEPLAIGEVRSALTPLGQLADPDPCRRLRELARSPVESARKLRPGVAAWPRRR